MIFFNPGLEGLERDNSLCGICSCLAAQVETPHVCSGTHCRKVCQRFQFQIIYTYYRWTCQLHEMTPSCAPCNIREECAKATQNLPPQRDGSNFNSALFLLH